MAGKVEVYEDEAGCEAVKNAAKDATVVEV